MQAIPKYEPFINYKTGEHSYRIEIELPPLIPDTYKISAWIGSHYTETINWETEIVSFDIFDSPAKGRSIPHSHLSGFMVPNSRIL